MVHQTPSRKENYSEDQRHKWRISYLTQIIGQIYFKFKIILRIKENNQHYIQTFIKAFLQKCILLYLCRLHILVTVHGFTYKELSHRQCRKKKKKHFTKCHSHLNLFLLCSLGNGHFPNSVILRRIISWHSTIKKNFLLSFNLFVCSDFHVNM